MPFNLEDWWTSAALWSMGILAEKQSPPIPSPLPLSCRAFLQSFSAGSLPLSSRRGPGSDSAMGTQGAGVCVVEEDMRKDAQMTHYLETLGGRKSCATQTLRAGGAYIA